MKWLPKIMFPCTLILLFCSALPAQELSRRVLGSAGDVYQHALFGEMHWTVGELAVSHFQEDIELAEGFHQLYYDLIVENNEPLPADWSVRLFPNPTADALHIELGTAEEASLQLFASDGRLLRRQDGLLGNTTLSLQQYPAGTYWLRLTDDNGRSGSFQIQKVNR